MHEATGLSTNGQSGYVPVIKTISVRLFLKINNTLYYKYVGFKANLWAGGEGFTLKNNNNYFCF